MNDVTVRILRLDKDLPLPSRAHALDAGVDLLTTADVVLAPGQRRVVPTGVAIALPTGYAGFVVPRSGLAARNGLTVVNSPGIVDAGYRGELKVCLLNTDTGTTIELRRGDRIAQLVVQQVATVSFAEVDALDETQRGSGGYGSSGGVAGWR